MDELRKLSDQLHFDAGMHHGKKKLIAKLLLPIMRGKSVLDFGCSTGCYSRWFGQVARSVVGIDISREAIHIAERGGGDNIRFVCGEGIPSGTYDVIVFNDVLEFIHDWRSVFDAAYKELSVGGILFVSTPNFGKPISYIERVVRKLSLLLHYPCEGRRRRARKTLAELDVRRGYASVRTQYQREFAAELEKHITHLPHVKGSFFLGGDFLRSPFFTGNHLYYLISKRV